MWKFVDQAAKCVDRSLGVVNLAKTIAGSIVALRLVRIGERRVRQFKVQLAGRIELALLEQGLSLQEFRLIRSIPARVSPKKGVNLRDKIGVLGRI